MTKSDSIGYASHKANQFTESVIREMTRLAIANQAVNLAQGFPDFPAPPEIKQAAIQAISDDINQYAITWGAKALREAIAWKFNHNYGVQIDPEKQITVCCGSTEGMIASLMATINPGDEVIVFEPFYENYGPDAILCGAVPKYVPLKPPEFRLDEAALKAAFTSKTRGIIINAPNNPTGTVFTRQELEAIARLCIQYDAVAFTDEIYEHILYDGATHIPLATLPGMAERTITVNSISKTYSVTGWRVGYVIASPEITQAIRKVHDFLTVGAAAPLQAAAAQAMHFEGNYYRALAEFYRERRDYLYQELQAIGLNCTKPAGAYYIMADITPLTTQDDLTFARFLVEKIGVAVVPGSSFYRPGSPDGRKYIRFCFCKQMKTMEEAVKRIRKLKVKL
ncbi:MAG TPA: aminotransferase class I/II-fold pyridoxal phosphate-dependent enzyme [Bacillota bacterium]|nr:aminotransferase class I/II-fold pyridoxal phosphate-dependent enzyme [Bacillota bacterium]